MDWPVAMLIILGGLIVFLFSGMPVAFGFLAINLIGAYLFWGGEAGIFQVIRSMYGSVASFSLVTLLLFVLMGDILFHSGLGASMIDAIDKWMGKLPGRLGVVAIAAGTLLATLSGSSMATTAIMGSVLTPEMEKRGYKKAMSLGPILGSSGLAKMIPPSAIAVVLAVLANVSVGKLLMAIIVPGLIMAVLYTVYTIIRCWLQPSIAPPYSPEKTSFSKKMELLVRQILPVGIVIFLVTGVIFLGIATPTEAAATGVVGILILVALQKKVEGKLLKKALFATIETSVMGFTIIAGARAFSQILAFSGATEGIYQAILGLDLSPLGVMIMMQVICLIMGCFMEIFSILMIVVPIYMPIAAGFGWDPIWFTTLLLLNSEMGATTPPYGLTMFVMKAVAPPDTKMTDIYKAGIPYLFCDMFTMVMMIAFPIIVLWLPGVMSG